MTLLSINITTLLKHCKTKGFLFKEFFLVFLFLLGLSSNLHSQSTDFTIQISGPDKIFAGEHMIYTINIANNGPLAATNANFNINFPSNVSNINLIDCSSKGNGVCPTSSDYNISKTDLIGIVPFLPVNGSISITVSLNAPSPALVSSFTSTATITPPKGMDELEPLTSFSSWNTSVLSKTDITVEKIVNQTEGTSCDNMPQSYQFTIKWINNGPATADGIVVRDYIKRNNIATGNGNASFTYNWSITNLKWSSSSNSIPPKQEFTSMFGHFSQTGTTNFSNVITNLKAVVPVFAPKDTIILKFTFNLNDVTITGCARNIEWTLRNQADFIIPGGNQVQDTVLSNNSILVDIPKMICNSQCQKTDIEVQNFVNSTTGVSCYKLSKSYKYTVKWINDGSFPANDIILTNMIRSNNIAFGSGNASFTYHYKITNILWSSSNKNDPLPSNFTKMNGSFIQSKSSKTYNRITQISSNPVPLFNPGDTITLTFTFTLTNVDISGCGRNINWNLRNEANFSIPSKIQIQDSNISNNTGIIDVTNMSCSSEPCSKTDITVEQSVSNNIGASCNQLQSYDFSVKWINRGNNDADGIVLRNFLRRNNEISGFGNATYTYHYNITNLKWSSSPTSTAPNGKFTKMTSSFTQNNKTPFTQITRLVSSSVPKFTSGDTITLTYTLTFNSLNLWGCGRNSDWTLRNESDFLIPNSLKLKDTIPSNNIKSIEIDNSASATDLVIAKTVSPQVAKTGDIVEVNIKLQNASSSGIYPAIWVDTIPASFEIDLNSIACKQANGFTPCENITYDPTNRILTQTIPYMAENSSLEIVFKGEIKALYTVTEAYKAYAINPCIECVENTNFTQTNYQINGICDAFLAGDDGDTSVCYTYDLPINLLSHLSGNPYKFGTWTRVSGTGGIFDTESGTFTPSPNASTSTFRYIVPENAPCKEDTSFVTIVIETCYCIDFNNIISLPSIVEFSTFNDITINGTTTNPTGGKYLWQISTSGINGPWLNANGRNDDQNYNTSNLKSGTYHIRRLYTYNSTFTCSDSSNILFIEILSPIIIEEDIIQISASPTNNSINVQWIKERELNIDFFEVYRSEDGKTFYKIGEVEANGISNKPHSYSFEDKNIIPGVTYYYQVNQIDYFGVFLYSNIANSIIISSGLEVGDIYPNPTDYSFKIPVFTTTETDLNIYIINPLGQIVMIKNSNIPIGNSEIQVENIVRLSQGSYTVVISSETEKFSKGLAVARD
jgi:uncharacterized repeat protein (TIGR01451 family)